MELHALGSSGLSVTPIGLGLAAIGRPGYINLGHGDDLEGRRSVEGLRDHAHRVLDAAWDAGVRYFDMARSYGRAEAFMRAWLDARGLTPDEVTVGSKWGYTYTADWKVDADVHEVKEHSIDVLTRQWGETQEHLGPYLDLYQIHSATLSTGVLENAAVLDELARLKAEGTAIGLSLSGAKQADTLRKALAVERDGRLLFDTVQATWNILEPSAGHALADAHEAGLGVIVKEAVANGRLTPRNDDSDFNGKQVVLNEQAERLNTTVDALAIAAALAQPWSGVVLSGATTVAHLRSNVEALKVAWDDEAADTLQNLAEDPETYWSTRSDLAWT